MIIRLKATSSAGVMLLVLLVISSCAMSNGTAESSGEAGTSSTEVHENDVIPEAMDQGEQFWNGDGMDDDQSSWSEQKEVRKRHLAALARDGDIAARRLHGDHWWNHAATNRDDEDEDNQNILKRTLASLARQGYLAALRNPHYDPESTSGTDEDQLADVSKRNLASLARQGDEAARRINYQTRSWSDRMEDDSPMYENDIHAKRNLASLARNGDAAARRLGGFQKRPWDGDPEYDMSLDDLDGYEKRNLASMARDGDPAALRLYMSRVPPQKDMSIKRHLGALAREGSLKTMWKYAVPRPSNYGGHEAWRQQPKRQDGEEEDEPEVASEEEPEEPRMAVKKHIAALARRGSLVNMRFPRRPYTSSWYKNGGDYDIRSNDGYKRNIQSLARTAPPGSGFRSSSRGRLWSPSYGTGYYPSSRHHSQERARGVRSTREGFLDILPRSPAAMAYRPAFRSYDAFRAPMAFVSRHMSKRASDAIYSGLFVDNDWVIPEEPHADGPVMTKDPNDHAIADAKNVAQSAQRLPAGEPEGQKVHQSVPPPKAP